MKILVAVDFSDQSLNAVDYAAEIAIYSNAKLVLLHVCDSIPPALDVPVIIPMEDIEVGAKDELLKIVKSVEQKYGNNLVSKSLVKVGFVVEEINLTAEENMVDLVVLGMRGAGYLTERLLGSITTSVIRKSKKTILVVGKDIRFRELKRILLATDGATIQNEKCYIPLKQLLNIFKSHLYIVHITQEQFLKDDHDNPEYIHMDADWLSHSISFHHVNHKNITTGINEFAQNHSVDLIVIVPHKHDFIDRIIEEPQTQKMVFHSITPLLTLPE